jgi:hypothetical protein
MYFYEKVQLNKYNRNTLKMSQYFDFNDRYGEMDIEEYSSVYAYSSAMYDHVESTGGIKGYKGEVATPFLHWDIDVDISESVTFDDAVRLASESTKTLCMRLIEQYGALPSNIKVFFSGKKGYHVYYYSPNIMGYGFSEKIPFIVKNVCGKISDGIKHIDGSVYNHTRIFRTPNSTHPDTGLHKVDVSDIILNQDIPVILLRAEDQFKSSWDTIDYDNDSDLILNLLILVESEYEAKRSNTGTVESSELIKLFQSGVQDGERNEMLTRIAGVLHNKGHDFEWMSSMVGMINQQSKNPLEQSEVDVITNSIHSYPVSTQIKAISIDNVHTIKSAGSKWYDIMAQNGFISFGPRYPHITKEMETSIPGDVIGIVAGSGVGKTQSALDMVNEMSIAMDTRMLFFSIEMSVEGVFFRIAITESEDLANTDGYIRPKDVARDLHNPDSDRINNILNNWERILIVDEITSTIEIEQYTELVVKELEKYNIKLGGIVIDYGQLLDGSEDKNGAKLARSLPSLAKKLRTRIFILLQLNKGVIGKYEEPTHRQIEGTGGWFQAMTHCLMMWRNEHHTNILNAKWEKTRSGITEGNDFCLLKEGLKMSSIDKMDEDPLA